MGGPIETTPTPPGTPQWGAAWKKAVKDNYLSTIGPEVMGSCYSYRDCYLDLDPTYKDRFGRPLMRLTFDFHENELKMSQFLTDRLAEIVQRMGPRQIVKLPRIWPFQHRAVSDDAYLRRRHYGHRPEDQRAQPLSAELGRAQSVCDRRHQLSAERRLQSNRHHWGADLLGARRDPQAIPEKPRTAGPRLRTRAMRCILLACASLLAATLEAGAQNPDKQAFEVIEHGRYMATAADCSACHTAKAGALFAGGGALETPFGTLLAPNITPDVGTGIGGWTDDQFDDAVRNGI